ncbi:MAG TPA: glutamate racemase [Candidatus Kapabacteria bacterium]|nr:glutamate racemase [Candidatus Kapabacteria bacterium]
MSSICVFDSGIGGLTVVKELFKLLPHERIVYFGDTARVPYGSKSVEIIRRYAEEDTELLLQHQPKLIIVGCNTLSAVALDVVKATARGIEVIGMIEPACAEALNATKNGRIGIIGTEATIASKAYDIELQIEANRLSAKIETFSQACPLFVPLAEEGWGDHKAAELIAAEYLAPLKEANVDTLILGCTHYPVLKDIIAKVVGDGVTLVNSGAACARLVKSEPTSISQPDHLLMVSDIPRKFQSLGERFLGYSMPTVRQVVYKEAWVAI